MSCVFTPADQMPWPVSTPFQMLPGMQRHGGPIFDISVQDASYRVAKQQALAAGHGHVGQAEPSVLEQIAQRYRSDTGQAVGADLLRLIESLPEDFVILHDEPQRHTNTDYLFRVRFLSVCFASNWRPAQKLGMSFQQIHEPVADNQRLLAAQPAIEAMAMRQTSIRRHVWLLSPNPELRQDPEQRLYSWQSLLHACDNDDAALLERVMFRVERQTTLPLPQHKRAVFFIRILVCPLRQVLALEPTRASQLTAALSSMSAAVLAYRGLTHAQPRLLRALSAFT